MPSERIVQALMIMSELYGKTFSQASAEMLVSDLSEYPDEDVLRALNQCRKELRYFPTVAEIISRIRPDEDQTKLPVLIAGEVAAAIAKFGSHQWTPAKEYLKAFHPAAWEVVRLHGGWLQICEDMTTRNKQTMISQIRDMAAGLIARGSLPENKLKLAGGATMLGADPVSLGYSPKTIPDGDKKK
jgi:hypothetical protein